MTYKPDRNTEDQKVKIIETPRDGFQGLKNIIPTRNKIDYLNRLLKAGFDTVEIGSFVSPKTVPQMADTEDVLSGLDLSEPHSRIMVLAGNTTGGLKAASSKMVDYILYPFSFSPTFLKRNLNTDRESSKKTIRELKHICKSYHKELIVYLTMAFGNPYGDPWSPLMVADWAGFLISEGMKILPLSDIMGDVTPATIRSVYTLLNKEYPQTEFGIHLHCKPGDHYEKVNAAWDCGIRRFDTVLDGFGGCPFASDHMVSNLDTRALMGFLEEKGIDPGINKTELAKAGEELDKLIIKD